MSNIHMSHMSFTKYKCEENDRDFILLLIIIIDLIILIHLVEIYKNMNV